MASIDDTLGPKRPTTPPLTISRTPHMVDVAIDSMLSNLRDVTKVGAVPVLGLSSIIAIATEILSTIQTFWVNDPVFNSLAFNASGLVCAVTLECQNLLNKRHNVPTGFQSAISTLAENLNEIKGLGERKRRRSRPSTVMFFIPDALRCVHYKAELQHFVDIFDILSKISIRSSVNIILRDVEKAAEKECRFGQKFNKSQPQTPPLSKSSTFPDQQKMVDSEKTRNPGGDVSPDSGTSNSSPLQSRTGTVSSSSRNSPLSRSPLAFRISDVELKRSSMSDIPSMGIFKGESGRQNEKRRSTK